MQSVQRDSVWEVKPFLTYPVWIAIILVFIALFLLDKWGLI